MDNESSTNRIEKELGKILEIIEEINMAKNTQFTMEKMMIFKDDSSNSTKKSKNATDFLIKKFGIFFLKNCIK